jgi:DNA modification methylase
VAPADSAPAASPKAEDKMIGKNGDYEQFIGSKRILIEAAGFDVPDKDINQKLFEFQRDIVRWALRLGKAALFEDCGLGKTPQQLEWARLVSMYTGKPVLILAPLAVSRQTQREGIKFDVPVTICATQDDVQPGVNITNYQKLHHFSPRGWGGIVLDESSILKGFDGKTRKILNRWARKINYRLCCTATPAPNDLLELSNHAEFLGIMSGKEIMALFFTQDGNSTHKWRLKGHARVAFWQWMAQWSVALRFPSDLGYDDAGFILPELRMHDHVVNGKAQEGHLLPIEAQTLLERRRARRDSLAARVAVTASLVNGSTEPWLIWCDLNAESDALRRAIPDAVEVKGSDSSEHKTDGLIGFSEGRYRVLVTKPTIAGFGMNWQHCNNMAFVGLSDSYEQQYQAIRRCWRFGQDSPVDVHVITADTEGAVVANIERKEKQATMMFDNVIKHMTVHSKLNRKTERQEMDIEYDYAQGKDWELYLGDSFYTLDNIEDNAVDLILFSPPFPGMYAYTNSAQDLGNSKDTRELIAHFNHMIPKLLRILRPGRLCAIHLAQEPIFKNRAGFVGRNDFRGEMIRIMQDKGWIYWSEVTIDKNPQLKASRTKEQTLLFKTLANDSTKCAPALADYLVIFKKRGDNASPVRAGYSEKYDNEAGWMTNDDGIEWAAPVWYGHHRGLPGGIRESDVLNVRQARETDDERHLAPLQLGVIERCVKLYTNPGDIVYSPFAGIGSEGYVSLLHNRRFIGGELKRSYYESAIQNLLAADRERNQPTLFDWAQMVNEVEDDSG